MKTRWAVIATLVVGLAVVASAQDTTSLLSVFLTNLRNGTLYVDVSNADVIFARDAADAIAQRRGTNAQTFRAYNTYTDGSNYERASAGWASNQFNLLVQAAGSGASRSMAIGTDASSSGNLTIQTSGTNRWQVGGSTGHLVALTDNTFDVGAAAATRPRTGYFGTSLNVAAGLTLKASADKLTQVNDNANATGLELNVGTPTLGTCTAGAITSGSHNFAGQYTGNTSSSCIINFGTPNFTNTPFCFAMSTASTTHPRISAASASSITVTGGVSGETIQYFCVGRIGT